MTETARKGDFGMLGDALVKVVGRYKKTKKFYGSIVTSDETPRRATMAELERILGWETSED